MYTLWTYLYPMSYLLSTGSAMYQFTVALMATYRGKMLEISFSLAVVELHLSEGVRQSIMCIL